MEKKQFVWVFTAEQAWDEGVTDTIIKVFSNEMSAIKHMYDFLHKGEGEESVVEYVERRGWKTEIDNPLFYQAYNEGYYPTEHIECAITKCKVEA